jgi:RNA polymerase sigma-70 factor (ECF subfamily)
LVDHKAQGLSSARSDPHVALMLRVKEEDNAMAFTQLVDSFQPRLLRVLRHIVGNEGVAEDLVQEVFMRVWRARKNYSPQAKFSTWIFHIAHNVASNSLRDRRRKREYQLNDAGNDSSVALQLDGLAVASTGAMPARSLDKMERAEMVRFAIQALNSRQRMALLLSRFEGLSYQEIADTMDLSVQAVKSLLSRARVNLKNLLEPYIAAGGIPGHPQTSSDAENMPLQSEQQEAESTHQSTRTDKDASK